MKRMRTSSSHLIKAMCKGVCGAAALAAIVFFAGCANPAGPGPGTGTGSGTDPGSGGGSVTAVTLNKTSAEVETGGTVEFAAAVSGTGDYSALVDWTLDGALDPDTALAVSSTTRRVTLTVGAGETPGELTLTAASRADSAKRARATVTVVRALAGIAWYVAADGDDDAANGGRSADAPFQTLARALEDIKETYLFDSEWPGKGTADAMRACIHIKGEITENMGSSSFLIESSADNAGEYPPIELRGLDQNSPGTLRAPSGKGVLKVAYNTVYLGPDLTLTGYSMETDAIGSGLNIGGGATVYLDGAKITLIKTSAEGAGVYVQGVSEAPAAFIMRSGAVMDNVSTRTTAGYGGGGVAIRAYASFTMSGGEISGNVAGRSGGGVFVYGQNDFNLSVFTMTGGDIKNNRAGPGANAYGGGVHLNGYCTFTMTGGTISGNTIPCTANSAAHTTHNSGAGIYASGNFFMGGSARVTADNEIALVASSTQLTTPRPLTICEPFTASPAGPVAKIELLGKGTYANPSLRWPGEQVIALGEGVSGGDIGRFTLGNFRMGAGASAFDQPITETCHIDDDGYLRLNGGE